jgi:extracellular elastinolytic metalloproteinase
LYWNLVDKYGFSPNYYDVTQNAGNIKAMRLVFGGFPLQPCNPTFITARDAILLADKNHYGGENKCLIWKAFAKRGLGVGAEQSFEYVNDFKLPKDCTA